MQRLTIPTVLTAPLIGLVTPGGALAQQASMTAGVVAAMGVQYGLGAQRWLARPDGPTCGIVTSVFDSVPGANRMQLHRATRPGTDQFATAIRRSQIGNGEGWHTQCPAMLAWSVLIASTLLFASLLHTVAATALIAQEQTAPPTIHFYDDSDLPGGTPLFPVPVFRDVNATPQSCSVPATEGKACIS